MCEQEPVVEDSNESSEIEPESIENRGYDARMRLIENLADQVAAGNFLNEAKCDYQHFGMNWTFTVLENSSHHLIIRYSESEENPFQQNFAISAKLVNHLNYENSRVEWGRTWGTETSFDFQMASIKEILDSNNGWLDMEGRLWVQVIRFPRVVRRFDDELLDSKEAPENGMTFIITQNFNQYECEYVVNHFALLHFHSPMFRRHENFLDKSALDNLEYFFNVMFGDELHVFLSILHGKPPDYPWHFLIEALRIAAHYQAKSVTRRCEEYIVWTDAYDGWFTLFGALDFAMEHSLPRLMANLLRKVETRSELAKCLMDCEIEKMSDEVLMEVAKRCAELI